VDVAPASFRRAIVFDLVSLDAAMPQRLDAATIVVDVTITFDNILSEAARVRTAIAPVSTSGWEPDLEQGSTWRLEGDTLSVERSLQPGEKAGEHIRFNVQADRLSFPPGVDHTVEYKGGVLAKESRRMEQVDVVPIYPNSSIRSIPAWQIIGPFPLGPIDTSHLPDDPEKANPHFYKRFGPEDGYEADRVYEGGRSWMHCDPLPNGLLNFNALMGTTDLACAYALCGVYSPTEQLVHATVYADNFAQVFLNGKLIEGAQTFDAPAGFVYVPLALQQGWNTVVAKIINNRADWFLRFMIADPQENLHFVEFPQSIDGT